MGYVVAFEQHSLSAGLRRESPPPTALRRVTAGGPYRLAVRCRVVPRCHGCRPNQSSAVPRGLGPIDQRAIVGDRVDHSRAVFDREYIFEHPDRRAGDLEAGKVKRRGEERARPRSIHNVARRSVARSERVVNENSAFTSLENVGLDSGTAVQLMQCVQNGMASREDVRTIRVEVTVLRLCLEKLLGNTSFCGKAAQTRVH